MPPRWGQVREFCLKQGYVETRTDHYHYLKVLHDRSTSGTMVSMGVDGEEVPRQMWAMVWRRQLRLASEEDFWRGLHGEPVQYAVVTSLPPPEPLPLYLTRFLWDVLHRTDEEIAFTTRERAQQELNARYLQELRRMESEEGESNG